MAALSVSVSVPLTYDVSAGVNVSCRLQVLPIASELRLFGAAIIGTVDVTERICSAAFPQFVTLRLSVPGVPIRIGPKSIKLVPKQTDGAAVAKSSLLMKLC
jgi:hypothetical protein